MVEHKEKIVSKSIFVSKMTALIDRALAAIDRVIPETKVVALAFRDTNESPAEFTRTMNNIQHDGTKTLLVQNGQKWNVITTCPEVIRMLVGKGFSPVATTQEEQELLFSHRANSTISFGTLGHKTAFCY